MDGMTEERMLVRLECGGEMLAARSYRAAREFYGSLVDAGGARYRREALAGLAAAEDGIAGELRAQLRDLEQSRVVVGAGVLLTPGDAGVVFSYLTAELRTEARNCEARAHRHREAADALGAGAADGSV